MLMNFSTMAQSSIQIGTKWTYSQYRIGGPIEPTYIEIEGDTTISGTLWYKIKGEGGCAFTQSNPPLIREEGQKWYVYNTNEGFESVLYDFELTEGESYFVGYFGSNFQIEVSVDSISTVSLNGVDRKIQYCSNPNSSNDGFFFGSEIIEGIGSLGYLLPQGNICDPHAGPIRCFETEMEFLDFDPNRECEDAYFPTSTYEAIKSKFQIYPNPSIVNHPITIESDELIENIEVFNSRGKKVYSEKSKSKHIEIEIPNEGVYYVAIKLEGANYFTKIVIAK